MTLTEFPRGLLVLPGRGKLALRLANFALVLWVAYALAKLTWLVVPTPELTTTERTAIQSVSQSVSPRNAEFQEVASWHLFGQAKIVKSQPTKPQAAPETRLNLRLMGVLSSDEKDQARAIIADPRGAQDSYSIGSSLPGDAEIADIYPDRVILLRNGRHETLRLEALVGKGSKSSGASDRAFNLPRGRVSAGARPAKKLNRSTEKLLREYQAKLKSNPSELMDSLNPVAVKKNGKLVGFKLSGGKYRQLLRGIGMRSGDVIIEINGVPLNDPSKTLQAISSMRSTKNFVVTALRRNKEHTFTFQIP